LARGGGRLAHDGRDLVERHREQVVQHEREAFGGGQRVQHDEQRRAHGIGQQRLAFGVDAADDLLGQRLLAAGPSGAQDVQAHAGDDRGQPPGQVVHTGRVRAVQPQPRLLHGVLGLARRTEHPVRHGPQARAVGLEPRRQGSAVLHEPLRSRSRTT